MSQGAGHNALFRQGDEHPKYNGGRWVNEWGYVRVSTGRTHNKYEHRMVIEQLMLEQAIEAILRANAQDWDGQIPAADIANEIMCTVVHPPQIPPTMRIHHIDTNRSHNCPQNLMLLDKAIHNAIHAAHVKFLRRYHREEVMRKLREGSTI